MAIGRAFYHASGRGKGHRACYEAGMAELLHIPYSPWSEKARWALDLSGLAHTRRRYQPLLGELELRVVLRRPVGVVSVPLFRDGATVLSDSFDIARHAAQHGAAALFPKGREAEVARYNALSERGLAAGRVLALSRMLASEQALLEMVPKALRKRLGKLALPIAAFGVRRTLRKYAPNAAALAEHERTLNEVLDGLRRDLAASDAKPAALLGAFSYADVAMAQVLAFVSPPARLPVGKASRATFLDKTLAERHADLIAWRDALYEAHRGPTEHA